ncbi:hypothetical protein DSM112329_01164 [Paraconexibacter sp. AEG42_29]|uniref:SGNH hydrolase-type esterase domain-containing protein n=1 Tax=Paraconexibacter sp. AEG42_29 TaxID=2997339 RepID=A0AAU7AS55_9ACTN
MKIRSLRRALVLWVVVAAATSAPGAAAAAPHWVTTWAAPTAAAFPQTYNTDADFLLAAPGSDRTLRMLARTTSGGTAVRVRLSNVGSASPLRIGAVTAAIGGTGAATRPGSSRSLLFGGRPGVTVAPGATVVSDGADLPIAAGQDVAVSVYLPGPALTPSVHAQAFRTNYLTRSGYGNATADDSGAAFTAGVTSVVVVDRVDVLSAADAGAVVVLGDSLSDGLGSTFDGHDRWTDVLAARLQAAGIDRSVVNAGLSGNSVDCGVGLGADGPDGVDRFDRDVLDVSGVRTVFLFAGTNDLANGCTFAQLRGALRGLADRARGRGLDVIAATLNVRDDLHYTAAAKADRLRLNDWIRTSGTFEHHVDFERAVSTADGRRDPRYDDPDGIHLNPAGYRRLGEAVDLAVLAPVAPTCTARVVRLRVPSRARSVTAAIGGRSARVRRAGPTAVLVRLPGGRPQTLTVRLRGRSSPGHAPFRRTVRVPRCLTAPDPRVATRGRG